MWYPPNCPAVEPVPFSPHPWFPLCAFVNDRVVATLIPASEALVDLPPVSTVVRSGGFPQFPGTKPGGFVHHWGLFPASDLGAMVLLAALGLHLGWGRRSLSPLELAALWDVPILVSDLLLESMDLTMIQGFCASAPAKVLFAGADALLTTLFRGGSTTKVLDVAIPGPQPVLNEVLGLVPTGDQGRGEVFDFNEQVVKGDYQKSDTTTIPNHLRVHSFLWGCAQKECAPAHLTALRLPAKALIGELHNPRPPSRGIGWVSSLKIFRDLGLHWWRRNLVQGFTRWQRAHIKINKGCLPSQMVKCSLIYRADRGEAVFYRWTTKGRVAYKAQWLFLRSMTDGLAMVQAELDAIRRALNASWFKWLKGSALFFWNWGKRYQCLIQDGQPHFVMGPFPVFLKPQKRHQDPAKHKLMRVKVVQVRKRGYILPGKVIGGTHYFCVDKGLDDIRMIYNGTSCGLNEVLFFPHFGLPTVKQTLRALLPGYFQCDLDVGEQFLNYLLHTNLREFSGVDVSGVQSADPADLEWERQRGPDTWERWE